MNNIFPSVEQTDDRSQDILSLIKKTRQHIDGMQEIIHQLRESNQHLLLKVATLQQENYFLRQEMSGIQQEWSKLDDN